MIPAGAFPLGVFTEQSTAKARRPTPILADYTDPNSGEIVSLTKSRTPVDGAIIEVLHVERGSGPAVQEVGHSMREVRHTDDSSLAELRGRLQEALRRMTKAGLVALQQTTVKRTGPREDTVEMGGTIKDLTVALQNPNQEATRTYAVARGSANG